MKKIIIAIVIVVILGAIGLYVKKALKPAPIVYKSYMEASYAIDGIPTMLSGAGAGAKYFGNLAVGDLNGDDKEDVAFVITASPGGSGTFYYAVAALGEGTGFVGTNAVILGDRIAPQSTEIRSLEAIFNYAERKPSEPMTAKPSVGVSKRLVVSSGSLTVVK